MLTAAVKTDVYLKSTTKGNMVLVKSNTWEFYENNMPDMTFVPSVAAATSELEL